MRTSAYAEVQSRVGRASSLREYGGYGGYSTVLRGRFGRSGRCRTRLERWAEKDKKKWCEGSRVKGRNEPCTMRWATLTLGRCTLSPHAPSPGCSLSLSVSLPHICSVSDRHTCTLYAASCPPCPPSPDTAQRQRFREREAMPALARAGARRVPLKVLWVLCRLFPWAVRAQCRQVLEVVAALHGKDAAEVCPARRRAKLSLPLRRSSIPSASCRWGLPDGSNVVRQVAQVVFENTCRVFFAAAQCSEVNRQQPKDC
jgi:hypothetical protein